MEDGTRPTKAAFRPIGISRGMRPALQLTVSGLNADGRGHLGFDQASMVQKLTAVDTGVQHGPFLHELTSGPEEIDGTHQHDVFGDAEHAPFPEDPDDAEHSEVIFTDPRYSSRLVFSRSSFGYPTLEPRNTNK